MNRRNFIKSSVSIGSIATLSGCIGRIRRTVPFWNDMTNIYPNSMAQAIPKNSHLESSGRISIEIGKKQLENKFDNIYEDPFEDYNSDITPLLHSRSSLSSVRPIINNRLSGHIGESDLLNKLNISDEYSEVGTVKRFCISEDLIIFNGSLSNDVIKNIWDLSEVNNKEIYHQYKLFNSNDSWVAVGKDWFGVPLIDYNEDEVINRFNNQSKLMNNKFKTSEAKKLNNGVSFGDVNIIEIGTDLEFIKDTFNISANGILSSSKFSKNGLETTTSIKFTEDFTESDIEPVISEIAGEYNISVNNSIAIINVQW